MVVYLDKKTGNYHSTNTFNLGRPISVSMNPNPNLPLTSGNALKPVLQAQLPYNTGETNKANYTLPLIIGGVLLTFLIYKNN